MLEPVIPKNALLIFDFDQTITNQSMCNLFVSKGYSDYNSDEANPVTEEKIEEFVQNSGIKNEAKLKSVLQSALSSGVEVAIVSLAYPKAVEYVVKNHLDLEEQAQSIKVFEGVTKRQTPQIGDSTEIAEKMTKPQDPQIGKHLCVLYLLKAYKKDKGMLPQKVMLVDGNMRNTNPVDDFRRNIKGLLKKDMKSFLENIDQEIVEVDIKEEEIENITFKGINVSSEPTTETDKTVDDGYLGKVKRWIEGRSDIPLTPPPSYKSEDGSEKSLLSESEFGINSDATSENKKTNRIWPRAKYAIQQKGFIIFSAAAIMFSASAALVYLQDKAEFAALFANGSLYVTIPVIALASLLVILPIYLAVKQFRNTGEYQTQGKNADKILDKVLEHQPKDKVIKSVRLEYSNGTHSNFVLNAWESKNDFINIDEKVVSRTNKIESVINDRPLFTALLASVVAANVALPLGLLTTGGVQTFYQNPLTNNIGLSLLVCSGALALLILCLGVHYYRKTNCTSLIYSQEKIDTENVNKKFVEEIERERTNVLKENHGKDAKCCSLTLEQVVVQSHNCKDAVYSVG